MSSPDKREDTASLSTSSSEDNVVEKASGNLEQMKLEELGIPTRTSTNLQAQDPIPGTSRDQYPGEFSRDQGESGSTPRKYLDCHAKESAASDSVKEPLEEHLVPPPESEPLEEHQVPPPESEPLEEHPVPPPEIEPLEEHPVTPPEDEPVDYTHYSRMEVVRFFMRDESLPSRRTSRSRSRNIGLIHGSGNTTSDVSDIPKDVTNLKESFYHDALESQISEESCSEFQSALETQGIRDDSTSASNLPIDSAPISISNLSISTDTGEDIAAALARFARETEMLGDPDTSSSSIAYRDQSEPTSRYAWFLWDDSTDEEDLLQREAVRALAHWMQRGAHVVAENPIEEKLDNERVASEGSDSRIVPPEIPPRRFITGACGSGEKSDSRIVPPEIPARTFISGEHESSTAGAECRPKRSLKLGNLLKKKDDNCSLSRQLSSDSVEPASTSNKDLSRSRSIKREPDDQAGPSESKKKHWQKSGTLRSLQMPLATSMVSIEEEIDSSKQAGNGIEQDSNPHPADDGLGEPSSGMENQQSFASESSKSDQPKNIPMEAETRDIYAPSTSNLPSSTKSKQKRGESCSSKSSPEHKGKSPISIGKECPDERSTRKDEDDDSKKEHEEKRRCPRIILLDFFART
ncbi:hypothetical protein CDAR_410181 [Caerostris darwini]|uniref:Uncharacterized protein n=1 Tax=Caerostris darwini TaxID=1538125 RepID=A0AAV4VX86_9ARAC|nr:hypothetical protein CDAR_410181 [Caerostris darwini]